MTNGEVILKLIKDVTGIELEIGEEFNIRCSLLKVTQKGLVNVDNGYECNVFLQEFIEDIKTIKSKPKFPPNGTRYYYFNVNGVVCSSIFANERTLDVLNYKTGNFFLREDEMIEQNREKIEKILNSAEKFKVMDK